MVGLNLVVCISFFPTIVIAEGNQLPEPLTLEAALATASNPDHYDISLINQKISEILALSGIEKSELGINVGIKGRIRKVGPSDSGDADDDNDSAASLLVSKPIYDFGVSDARLNTLALQHQVMLMEKQQVIERRRLSIMGKYFDVLNADNEFISENESLAIGFIRYDHARENLELGSSSEIDVTRLQADYERIRQRFYQAQNRQRLTRMSLAEAMGYAQQLPTLLEAPEVDIDKPLSDDIEYMINKALTSSNESKLLNGRSRLAESSVRQADAINSPRLDFELEISTFERETSTRDDWRASIYFDVPLYSTVRSSGIALAQTRYQKSLSEISRYKSQIRLRVLQFWQSVEQNRLIAQGAEVEQNYRDMYLDRSRAEYELEFRSDLGDAMVQFSHARTERLRALYAFELAYNQLQALVGEAITQVENTNEEQ
ncbi:MAG: TolC family protein [Gammaproteobacteria bacterium]|nr:TolC family protein [Gammaproteobacteria bacterium]